LAAHLTGIDGDPLEANVSALPRARRNGTGLLCVGSDSPEAVAGICRRRRASRAWEPSHRGHRRTEQRSMRHQAQTAHKGMAYTRSPSS